VLEANHRGDGKARRRARIIAAAIGPLIAQPNYEVGAGNSSTRFTAQDAANARFFAHRPSRENHAMFDLPGYIKVRLDALRSRRRGPRPLHLCGTGGASSATAYHSITLANPDYGRPRQCDLHS
jgi:copper oxidase (laccase) domain-containing protein